VNSYTQISIRSQKNPIRLLSAEYHRLNVIVLKRFLQNCCNIKYVGNAVDVADIIRYLDESAVDVLLLDVNMPGMDRGSS
jgi:DNA-binding NarL/FixJ family response regulator